MAVVLRCVNQIRANAGDISLPAAADAWVARNHPRTERFQQSQGNAFVIAEEQDDVPITQNPPILFAVFPAMELKFRSIRELPFQPCLLGSLAQKLQAIAQASLIQASAKFRESVHSLLLGADSTAKAQNQRALAQKTARGQRVRRDDGARQNRDSMRLQFREALAHRLDQRFTYANNSIQPIASELEGGGQTGNLAVLHQYSAV